jgi:putative Mg2+ transporter-C (MgtC) family protein
MVDPAMGVFDSLDNNFLVRVGVSLMCGCIVGLEREWRGKPTGMRTCVLLCLGTALFVHMGIALAGGSGDTSRVLGQVVTGIGFLGGGVIMGRGDIIYGVTTATVVWILAATGALIGVGKYSDAVAIAIVTVIVLTVLDYVERGVQRLRQAVLSRPPDKTPCA